MSRFGLPAETFQINDKLNFTLNGIIRKKVQQAYETGLNSVEEIIRKRIPTFELFMSGVDIDNIMNIAKSMLPEFWITMTKLLQRKREVKQQDITLKKKNEFDIDAAITKLASFIIYTSYNFAIDSKLKNIMPGQRQASSTLTRSAAITDDILTPDDIDEAFGEISILDSLQEMLNNMQEMFLTKEDQDVDLKICEPLNRSVYGIDDANKPDPPLHPYCRCILVPVEKEVSSFFAS